MRQISIFARVQSLVITQNGLQKFSHRITTVFPISKPLKQKPTVLPISPSIFIFPRLKIPPQILAQITDSNPKNKKKNKIKDQTQGPILSLKYYEKQQGSG